MLCGETYKLVGKQEHLPHQAGQRFDDGGPDVSVTRCCRGGERCERGTGLVRLHGKGLLGGVQHVKKVA